METIILGVLGIAATVSLALFVQWKTNKAFKALFKLICALPGGDAAQRIYDDMLRSGQVRGLPYQTKDGKWAVAWKIPAYKGKTPEP
jgi:hypothetical protein